MIALLTVGGILWAAAPSLLAQAPGTDPRAAAPARKEAAPPAKAAAQVGQPAPDFTLPDAEGAKRTLSASKGKFVVLEWTNHECPFVKKHYGSGNMQRLQRDLKDEGIVWYSIISSAPGKQGSCTPDEAKTIAEERHSAAAAILLDPQGKVGRLYGAKTTPHLFVINPQGILIYDGAMDDKPTADPADLQGAKNYVRACLAEALSKKPVTTPRTRPYGCAVKY